MARDALDIDGLGEKIVVQLVQLVQLGLIEDFADLFTLTRDQILSLERMGERSTDNLLAAIETAKAKPLPYQRPGVARRSHARASP